jgi:transposase
MEAPEGMLTEEDDVEIHALARRGWSVSAIARHTGRDRKTVRRYLTGPPPSREPAPSCLEPFRDYLVARFGDDAHVDGTVLHREVVELGFDRSYVTFVRQLRLLGLRPRCEACRTGGHGVTVELAHEPGEEIQWDWLELRETPWREPAYVLVGALSFSGRCRGDQRGHDVRPSHRRDRRGAASPGRHAAGVAHRPDGDRRSPRQRPNHGTVRAGRQALRR